MSSERDVVVEARGQNQTDGGDVRVLNEIRQRVADGYESASSRNVITVAALTLKDLHYVLSSHDGQFTRGATAMRDACVDELNALLAEYEEEQRERTEDSGSAHHIVRAAILAMQRAVARVRPLTLDPNQ